MFDDIDNDISERFHHNRIPQPFFHVSMLNATKDRAISGKLVQANPFEFCSNEFSSGQNNLPEQTNMIDSILDQIKQKRASENHGRDSNYNHSNLFGIQAEPIKLLGRRDNSMDNGRIGSSR
jgi:hypothetical protein